VFRNWPAFGDPVQTVGGDSGGVGDAGFVVLVGDGDEAFDVVAAHATTTGEHRDGPFHRPGRQCTSQRLNPSRPLLRALDIRERTHGRHPETQQMRTDLLAFGRST
jgi:hypothetical protein